MNLDDAIAYAHAQLSTLAEDPDRIEACSAELRAFAAAYAAVINVVTEAMASVGQPIPAAAYRLLELVDRVDALAVPMSEVS